VLLLHGYPESLQIFSRLAPLLAASHHVIALDWPGMGASEAWSGGASPIHMAERLIRLMDHWELERADLVAMDMGGQPALVAAAEYPDRVRRLVVMNSLVLWDEATSLEIRFLRKHGFNRFVIERFPRLVFRRAERTFLVASRLLPELRAELWSHFRRIDVRRFVSRMCAGYQGLLPKLPSYYERIRLPTTILWGSQERHFPVAHAERLHALVPGSALAVVDGGGHWMVWERAGDVAARVHAAIR
jgi:pimeloyl-ACP methyl ester carboxylesterase